MSTREKKNFSFFLRKFFLRKIFISELRDKKLVTTLIFYSMKLLYKKTELQNVNRYTQNSEKRVRIALYLL